MYKASNRFSESSPVLPEEVHRSCPQAHNQVEHQKTVMLHDLCSLNLSGLLCSSHQPTAGPVRALHSPLYDNVASQPGSRFCLEIAFKMSYGVVLIF